MKILLIDPPFKTFTGFVNFYYPIGLGYLVAVLRGAGYQAAIFDVDALNKRDDIDFSEEYKRLELYRQGLNNNNHIVWGQIGEKLDSHQPDLVGITAMTPKFGSVLKTAEIIKKWNPKCLVVVGGPHPTLLPEQTLKSKDIDIIVRGEGEKTFLELIKVLETNSDLRTVKGISFKPGVCNSYIRNKFVIRREDIADVIHNPPREFIESLDSIPFPARDALMNSKKYTSENMGAIMASRGCPFNCTYCCHFWQRRVRHRSPKNVVREIKQVKDKYGTSQFEFKDDTFTVNRNWVIELCQRLISEKARINWGCTTRANLIDKDLVRIMKKAGCNVVKLGIETGSQRILEETKKGVTFKQMEKAAQILNKVGLFWSGYFMMGLPNETEEDILKTYKFMKQLNPHYAGLGVYNPFPKTELFNQAVEMGLLHEEVELDHFFKTNPKDYFFVDPTRRTPKIDKKRFNELSSFMMGAFHKHNTQFKNIIRRGWARRFVYIQDPKLMLSDIKKALNWWL